MPRRTRPTVVSASRSGVAPFQGMPAASSTSGTNRAYGCATRATTAMRWSASPSAACCTIRRATARASSSGSGADSTPVPTGASARTRLNRSAGGSAGSGAPSAGDNRVASRWAIASSTPGSPVSPSTTVTRSAAASASTSVWSAGVRTAGRCTTTWPTSARRSGAAATAPAAATREVGLVVVPARPLAEVVVERDDRRGAPTAARERVPRRLGCVAQVAEGRGEGLLSGRVVGDGRERAGIGGERGEDGLARERAGQRALPRRGEFGGTEELGDPGQGGEPDVHETAGPAEGPAQGQAGVGRRDRDRDRRERVTRLRVADRPPERGAGRRSVGCEEEPPSHTSEATDGV